jgi:hypothetical protein
MEPPALQSGSIDNLQVERAMNAQRRWVIIPIIAIGRTQIWTRWYAVGGVKPHEIMASISTAFNMPALLAGRCLTKRHCLAHWIISHIGKGNKWSRQLYKRLD